MTKLVAFPESVTLVSASSIKYSLGHLKREASGLAFKWICCFGKATLWLCTLTLRERTLQWWTLGGARSRAFRGIAKWFEPFGPLFGLGPSAEAVREGQQCCTAEREHWKVAWRWRRTGRGQRNRTRLAGGSASGGHSPSGLSPIHGCHSHR